MKNDLTNEILDSYQPVRVVDFLVLGPAMIYAGTFKALPDWLRVLLVVSGICTIWFNGRNYMRIKERSMNKSLFSDIERTQGQLTAWMMSRGNIHGVGIMQDEDGEYLEVAMSEMMIGDELPHTFQGYRIKYVVTPQPIAQAA